MSSDWRYMPGREAPSAWPVRYQREVLEFDKDVDFSTKNALASAYERYSAGITDWRRVYGSPGA